MRQRSRIGRVAAAAALGGVLAQPDTAAAYPQSPVIPRVPEGAVAQAWAFATVTAAHPPQMPAPCAGSR